jgi:hypothetical protein
MTANLLSTVQSGLARSGWELITGQCGLVRF